MDDANMNDTERENAGCHRPLPSRSVLGAILCGRCNHAEAQPGCYCPGLECECPGKAAA